MKEKTLGLITLFILDVWILGTAAAWLHGFGTWLKGQPLFATPAEKAAAAHAFESVSWYWHHPITVVRAWLSGRPLSKIPRCRSVLLPALTGRSAVSRAPGLRRHPRFAGARGLRPCHPRPSGVRAPRSPGRAPAALRSAGNACTGSRGQHFTACRLRFGPQKGAGGSAPYPLSNPQPPPGGTTPRTPIKRSAGFWRGCYFTGGV
ncbi:hypothetical protein [Desulfofundulus thermosubterraneus]|nr:hypothetical protein [Desulfofundulus thermosubterraneus]